MADALDLEALAEFAAIARELGQRFVLVGAGARLLLMDRRFEAMRGRATTDWDIGVQLESWDGFERLHGALLAWPGGPFEAGEVEHRIRHTRAGTPFDLIPYGPIAGEQGGIVWPRGETEMTVLGFQETYENADVLDVGGRRVRVATPPAIAMLKVFAFSGRALRDDATDLLFVLDNYLDAGNEERAFGELFAELSDANLDYERWSPWLLGADLAGFASGRSMDRLRALLRDMASPYSALVTALVRRLGDEDEERRHRQRLAGRIEAFLLGLGRVATDRKREGKVP